MTANIQPGECDSVHHTAQALLVANDRVWIEGEALRQLDRVAAMPDCTRAVGMPDLHPGRGIPVGAAFAFRDRVHPLLIGNDAGCGARVIATSIAAGSLDAIERRLRNQWDDDPLDGAERSRMTPAVWRAGLTGLVQPHGGPRGFDEIVGHESSSFPTDHGLAASCDMSHDLNVDPATLGTIGGGNHFVEVARVAEVRDPALASRWGFRRGCIVVVAHSGSRGLGEALARKWESQPLVGAAMEPYLSELGGVCRFAQANRFLLAYRTLRAIGAARASKITASFDVIHNHVAPEPIDGTIHWIHRKGAAPAWHEQPTIVLGSRGAASWVFCGAGNETLLRSIAHGAGRRMGRSEAREKLKLRYRRSELLRTRLGSRVLCDDPALLFEEHPDAYKAMEPIIASIEDARLATPVVSLVPLLTVKR